MSTVEESSSEQNDDEQAILDMLIPRAQARLDDQLRDSDALDTKALGVLALDAAAIALIVAVKQDINSLWWIPTAALGVAGAFLLATLWPRRYDVGPDTREFYEQMGSSTRLGATRQMLAELLKAIEANDKGIQDAQQGSAIRTWMHRRLLRKSRLFKMAFAVLIVALLGSFACALT